VKGPDSLRVSDATQRKTDNRKSPPFALSAQHPSAEKGRDSEITSRGCPNQRGNCHHTRATRTSDERCGWLAVRNRPQNPRSRWQLGAEQLRSGGRGNCQGNHHPRPRLAMARRVWRGGKARSSSAVRASNRLLAGQGTSKQDLGRVMIVGRESRKKKKKKTPACCRVVRGRGVGGCATCWLAWRQPWWMYFCRGILDSTVGGSASRTRRGSPTPP